MSSEQLTQQQIKEYKEAFAFFDKDEDQKVSKADLEKTFLSLGENKSQNDIRKMIEECDSSRTGFISFTEFLTVLSQKLKNTDREEKIREAFRAFDEDGHGSIPSKELKDALCNWGEKFTEQEWGQMRNEIGAKDSGDFDYEQFISKMLNKSQ
ncbi:calmodulin [Naegleria gruberi]|uniref:Calmodulin n=1 Tax=Naegleria gruberi TaxID=5762 RepID=D2VML2_NAEGR|nr:calmodulin [Naegleria gruberi]EFC42004.1 calmodulin [Naegleria gruberi]|eukprot:XP_002674748.1 calmodulin [Naegleria gruberi]